ncbi:MAG: fibronectin type III domain-containing protein [Candidatus Latescibacteria bacterium]|nr:fibronectin type III domain-containing protein [Candidatus Latescibacterota bacterium]
MPTGEYYIYAMIQDSTNAPSFSYSPGTIRVVSANAPAAPTNFSVAATDSSIRVSWNPSTSAGVLGYTIHYTTDPNASQFDHQITPIDTTAFEIKGLTTGRTYKLAITAFDTTGLVSPFSNTQTVQLVSSTVNNPPVITSKPVANAVEGSPYTYQVEASDADGSALTFNLALSPSGMAINSSSGLTTWTPDAAHVGVADVIVTVSDGAASDSQSFVINVADLAASIGSIQLDRSSYTGPTAQAFITVRDIDLNTDPAIRDSARVTVISGSDAVGISFAALETGVSTGVFVGTLGFSTTGSNSAQGLIRVTYGDTISVVYTDAHPAGQRTVKAVWREQPVAVEIADVAGTESEGKVRLEWRVVNQKDHAGFNVLRSITPLSNYRSVNQRLITGGPTLSFVDTDVQVNTTYYYRLQAISIAGDITTFGPVEVKIAAPRTFALGQSYPNPFNAQTTIKYELPKTTPVKLVIYNILGQQVRTLVDAVQPAGYYTVQWNGRNASGRTVASGVYTYRMEAGTFVQTRKMLLVK